MTSSSADMNSEGFRVARNAIIAERVGHDTDCEAPSGDGPCACGWRHDEQWRNPEGDARVL